MNVLLVNLAKMVGYSGGMQKVASSFANEMKLIRGFLLLMFAIIRGNPLLIHGI